MDATSPPAKDFPVEIWMRIFEHTIHSNNAYARPEVIEAYKKALGKHAAIRKVLKKLRPFERRFWSTTRNYYAINRNSRAAAVKLRLARELLASCKQPVELEQHTLQHIKEHMPSGTAVLHLTNYEAAEDYLEGGEFLKRSVFSGFWSCVHFFNDYEHVVILAPLPPFRGLDLCSDMLEISNRAGEIIHTDRRERGVAAAKIEVFL